MRFIIQVAVVDTFCMSWADGLAGKFRTALVRNRTSSRIEAVDGCMPSESTHSAKGMRQTRSGVLSSDLNRAGGGSWRSYSFPLPRKPFWRNGEISSDIAMTQSELGGVRTIQREGEIA